MAVGERFLSKIEFEQFVKNLRSEVVYLQEGVYNAVEDFIDLGDVPANYAGDGLDWVRVNVGETGLEFFTPVLDDISDVDILSPVDGEVLTFIGSLGIWMNLPPAGGAMALDDLTDVNAPAPNDDDVLTWDNIAGEWVAAAIPPGGAHALGDHTDVIFPTGEPDDGDVLTYVLSGGYWTSIAPAAGGAPDDAEYVVGAANGSLSAEIVKQYLGDNYDLDVYPGSPDALDDEFEDGSINVKWTIVNDPGIAENTYAGFIYCPLAELGTDNFDNLIRMYQTPPTGTAYMTFIAKVSISVTGLPANDGAYGCVGVYLGNSVDDELVAAVGQLGTNESGVISNGLSASAGTISNMTTVENKGILASHFFYVKLEKSTNAAYTSANTYNAYFSLNGILWYQCGTQSKAFTNLCNEVGIIFRRPASQTGTPVGEAIADFFRRIV